MKKVYITFLIIILYIAFLCKLPSIQDSITNMMIALMLLVMQSMNTAWQFSGKLADRGLLKFLKDHRLNLIVLMFGMYLAFTIFVIY